MLIELFLVEGGPFLCSFYALVLLFTHYCKYYMRIEVKVYRYLKIYNYTGSAKKWDMRSVYHYEYKQPVVKYLENLLDISKS